MLLIFERLLNFRSGKLGLGRFIRYNNVNSGNCLCVQIRLFNFKSWNFNHFLVDGEFGK